MAANQPPWPREWLMTDERIGDRLWEAMRRLPPGAGVVFRHYATSVDERTRLATAVAELCRQHGLTLAVARDVDLAQRLGAQLVHNPASDPGAFPFSRSAHSLDEARIGWVAGAPLIFLSPLFPTRSHPGAEALAREEHRITDSGFGSAVEDFYQTNPIARASSIMAELSALTRENEQEATGTDG